VIFPCSSPENSIAGGEHLEHDDRKATYGQGPQSPPFPLQTTRDFAGNTDRYLGQPGGMSSRLDDRVSRQAGSPAVQTTISRLTKACKLPLSLLSILPTYPIKGNKQRANRRANATIPPRLRHGRIVSTFSVGEMRILGSKGESLRRRMLVVSSTFEILPVVESCWMDS